jgi:NAD(P)-dependent dehydrogenase (short-subunit alcohol dehydrogenase family)
MTQKVAVIYGRRSGIGKSTAMLLASKGIKVVINGRREAVGQKAIEETARMAGMQPSSLLMSITKRRSVRSLGSR